MGVLDKEKAFILLGLAWLLDMVALSRIGPPAREPLFFALFGLSGFFLMLIAAKICVNLWTKRRIMLIILILGIFGRLVFLSFQMNDVIQQPFQGNMPRISWYYAPFAALLFRGLVVAPEAAWMFRIVFFGFDFFVLVLLLLLVRQRGYKPSQLIYYALNPLVLVFMAGEGHVPVIQAAFLLSGLYLLVVGRALFGFFALGLAVMSGYLAILVFPFVMTASNRRAWWAASIPFLCFAVYLDDPSGLWRSLHILGSLGPDAGGLPGFFGVILGGAALPVIVALLLAGIGSIYLLEQDLLRSVYLAAGLVLVLITGLGTWHVLMIAPFMVFFPSKAWLFLMMTAIVLLPEMGYEPQTRLPQAPWQIKILEYTVFFAFIAYDLLKTGDRSRGFRFPPSHTVSVVIPALNEEDHVAEAIQSAKNIAQVTEIIVVDGGSVDRTRKVACETGALVLPGPQGRGFQISKGIAHTSGEIIIVLHADTILKAGAVARMLEMLANHPSAPGGSFGMSFDGTKARIRFIAGLNNVRARLSGISFGDQGQFFRRAALPAMNGFPEMLLMEDVELSLRLKALGPTLFVPNGVNVSQRRWEKGSFTVNACLVVRLFVKYLITRRFFGTAGRNQNDYYKIYYKG